MTSINFSLVNKAKRPYFATKLLNHSIFIRLVFLTQCFVILKFASRSKIRVRAQPFASQNIGDKYPKFCPLDFSYDPDICVVDLCEFSWAVYSLVTFRVTFKQIICDSLSKIIASKLETRSNAPLPRPPNMKVPPGYQISVPEEWKTLYAGVVFK